MAQPEEPDSEGTDDPETPEPAPKAKSGTARRWVGRGVGVVLGILAGLAIAEVGFSARDDGAFPHLNLFVADEVLAMRLEPAASMRLRFGDNPPTDIHVGAEGFRGESLGGVSDEEILVVGDSQVFGLGVEDDETFSHVLGELTGRRVINAGVPTYGPLEYNEVVREVVETRRPTTVVYVVNMANDFFEHARPNTERHAVWDGWAVRAETAPHDVAEFPGRALLFRHSHAFYALRRWLHETDDTIDAFRETGFASEGTLRDLVATGEHDAEDHAEAEREHREEIAGHHARIVGLEHQIDQTERAIDTRIERDQEPAGDAYFEFHAARGHPGDIVSDGYSEDSRYVTVTASLLARGVRLRQRLMVQQAEEDERSAVLLERRGQLIASLEEERTRGIEDVHVPSVLEERLREVEALCDEHGAELIVVALPLDVLVSEEEFAKYGAEPIDVSASRLLLTDLVGSAERLGARGLDATDALREASPGAFLDGDLHLSPSGHRTMAEAIAARLEQPAPLRHPHAGLPEGRTSVPDPEELVHAGQVTVTGSSAAGCATHLVREWLRISCQRHAGHVPTGVALVEGGRHEAMIVTTADGATLLAPIFAGDDLVADFHWTNRTQRLTVHWPDDAEAPEMSFGERLDAAQPEANVTERATRLCECHRELYDMRDCVVLSRGEYYDETDCNPSCQELYGDPREACFEAYGDECDRLLRCVRGDPEAPTPCADGEVRALGTARCAALCRPASHPHGEVACAEGECVPWHGAFVCAP